MKSTRRQALTILFLSFFFVFGIPCINANAQYEDTYVSYNDFYQDLAPYGQWIQDPQYGYVWSPNVDGSFRPYYTSGHWVMTDYGNTWISDYPWGWACFHYGRWTYDSYYGWLWIPGTDWGPAWVGWREGDGYYGWAPLGPGYTYGTSTGDYSCPNDWWVFIPPQYIYTGSYYHYWYGPRGNSNIIHNTTFIRNTFENNHVTYVTGPQVKQVEQLTNQPVQVFKLTNSNSLTTREHNGVIKMYRPAQINPSTTINGQRVLPPNAVAAPQPVANKPQSTNGRQTPAPEFRNDIPASPHVDATGTHASEPVKETPKQRNVTSPYEYDVNRPVTQPQPGAGVPQRYQPEPQPQRPQPENTRPQPPAAPRESPPQRQNPAPAPQPRQAPAPAPRQAPQQEGGRR